MRPWFSCTAAAPAAATAADVVAEADDVGVLGDDLGHLHLVAQHLVEADALDALDADLEAALILARQEALRHHQEQVGRAGDQHQRHGQRQRAVLAG